MQFITPSLAVGSLADAADPEIRSASNIGAVLSLLDVDFDAGATHAVIAVADRQPLPPAAVVAATQFIEREIGAGRKVLVHCQMGLSRSPAIAAAYLHQAFGISLADAIAWIACRRPGAAPDRALVDSLQAIYADTHVAATPADLSANENPLGPSPHALAALRAALPRCHRYPDRQGKALRLALADRCGVATQQLILGNGSCELLDIAARAFLAPGDEAIVAVPSFLPYRSAIAKAHGRALTVPLRDFAHDLPLMAAQIGERTRLVFIGNPNNPTGTAVDSAALTRFLEQLPPQVVVLLDEAYRDYLVPGGDDGAALVRAGLPLIVVRSFSKLHALAGLRIGYALAAKPLIDAMEAVRPHYNTNALAQAAALAALADTAHQEASRRLAADGLAQLAQGCEALGLDWVPSAANFLLVRVGPVGAADAVTAELAERGVLVKSGAPFGLPEHLRVSVGLADENTRFLAALAGILATNTPEQAACRA